MTQAQQTITALEVYEIGDCPMGLVHLFDESLIIECVVTANIVRDSYGVPGSPEWMSAEDETVDSIEVNGVEYSVAKAQETFGQDAVDMIWEMAVDAAVEKGEWE